MDADALIQAVRESFKDVPRPDADSVISHACAECYELRDALSPYGVDELPDSVLERHRWDLPLLSADGKKYYLPAWLTRSIERYDTDYTDALRFALETDHRWDPTVPYSASQLRVIRLYLEFVAERTDPLTLEQVLRAREKWPL